MVKTISSISFKPQCGMDPGDTVFSGGDIRPDCPDRCRESTAIDGISAYWRKNTSSRESIELANLLRALRKVAGHLGANTGRIEYDGMSSAADGAIRVSPEWVMGQYPVPSEKVDPVIGHVVHEALHRMEWSTHVWKLLEPDMESMPPLQKVMFQKMVVTGEDIYVDRKSDLSVFGLYTAVLRGHDLADQDARVPSNGISVDELMLTWRAGLFDDPAVREPKPEYSELLDALNHLARRLYNEAGADWRVTKKCQNRASFYRDAWKQVEGPIKQLPVYHKQLYWFSRTSPARISPAGRTGGAKPGKPALPRPLVREIQTCLAADAVDITPLIRSVAGYDNETVEPMSRWDFNMPSRPVIDRRMIGRLKAVFQNYAARRTIVSRGLLTGRLDPGRLYRAPVNGRCFREDLRIPNPDWCIGLLMDASGSMRGIKWKMVESIIANLHKALSGDKNRLNAWAYFESGGIAMLSRLIKENTLMSVPPSGQTASGQAIIAAAMMMPKNRRQKILIHVTDGESNFGCDVSYGIELCRKEKIDLITLGCGYRDRQAMQEQYGRAIQFIDHFEQLPRAMEHLVKSIFLFGAKAMKSRFSNTISEKLILRI
jgi:hypothetical protein